MTRITAREKLLDTATELFPRQGYDATGVDELIECAGVSKGSFYHAFKSKEDLGLAVLDEYFRSRRQRLAEGPHRQIGDPVDRVLAFLDHAAAVADETWSGGCILATFSAIAGPHREAFLKRLQQLFRNSEAELAVMFSPVVKAARERGVANPPSAEVLAADYLSLTQGAIVQARLFEQPQRMRKTILGFRHYLELLARGD